MPTYNSEQYIGASISSIINQTYTNWELIIIDDGSKDNTSNIIKEFQKTNKNIFYHYQSNQKQAKARNLGVSLSKGEIIAFLDSDDLWLPNKLEESINNFNLEEFDLIFTNAYVSENPSLDNNFSTYNKIGVNSDIYYGNYALNKFIERNRIPMLTVLMKKKVFINNNGFDVNIPTAEDYDFWVRLIKSGSKFISIDKPMSIYRFHNQSSTASDRRAADNVLKVFRKNFTAQDIRELKAQNFILNWIRYWINIYLISDNDYIYIENYLKHFKLFNIRRRSFFIIDKIFKTNFTKKLLLLNF